MTEESKYERLAPGLTKVRKELPSPGKVFKDKKAESRDRSSEALRQGFQDPLLRHLS